jgi:nucleotide sugar dehydrogenase
MKIGVIGAGRLGICFALLCEQAGYEVVVSDCREDYVKDLQNRIIETNEPEVQRMLLESTNLTATTDNQKVIDECEIIYTLVATPSLPDGSYDVSAVWDVVDDVKKHSGLILGKTFVIGCTTNPGDCERIQKVLDKYGIEVFYNPEFIAQGSIVHDLRRADMVLIGGNNNLVYADLCELYHKIQETEPKISFMSTTAAETVKLAVNCFLTTKISYANMVGEVMTLAGLGDEIDLALQAIGADTRVGGKYLKYGYGYGGPCLPRDNRAFAAYAEKLGLEYNLGSTTDNFNDEHADFLVNYFIAKNVEKLPFGFQSVAYKKGTDIVTESQQYRLCKNLLDLGYKIYVVEDQIKSQVDERINFETPEEAVYWIDL